MKQLKILKMLKLLELLTAALIIISGLTAVILTLHIYLSADGTQIYTVEKISAALRILVWPVALSFLSAIVTALISLYLPQGGNSLRKSTCLTERKFSSKTGSEKANTVSEKAYTVSENTKAVFACRLVLAALAVVLLTAGVLNGSMYDVLVKAINICTECIGLG